MNKLLSDTRYVLAFVALVVICATVLVALDKVLWADAIKVLSGLLGGLLMAWRRGSELSEEEAAAVKAFAGAKDKADTNKVAVPPVLPLLGICLAFLLLPGATCAQAKPIIRNANDIAADWCAAHYSQVKGLSVEDALRTFCTGEKLLKPWLDLILMGQKNGVAKLGSSPGETKCEITVTPPAVTDAGKD